MIGMKFPIYIKSPASRKTFLWICLILICGKTPIYAQQTRWSHLPDLPVPVSNNAATSLVHSNGTTTIYTFMGITDPNDTESITSTAYKITIPADKQWTRIADVPSWQGRARIAASAVTVGGEIYLLGGYTVNDDHSETTDPRLLRYEQLENTWTEFAGPDIEVDDTVALVYADRYIILCSGWHGPITDNTRAVQIYDTKTNTWASLNDMPGPATGLFGHAGGISGNTIIIANGTISDDGYKISHSVFTGEIITDESGEPILIEWMSAPKFDAAPTYRAAFASSDARNGHILIVGGTSNPYNITGIGYDSNPSLPNSQVLLYDAYINEWLTLESNEQYTPTMDHRALVPIGSDGTSWAIIGGMTAPGEATNIVQKLKLVLE